MRRLLSDAGVTCQMAELGKVDQGGGGTIAYLAAKYGMYVLDAGVPIKAPCAGIAMGLMKEGDNYVILTDIMGMEDHLGDMDFKVVGTRKGITALQMDIKIDGLTTEIMAKALEQARVGRLEIIDKIEAVEKILKIFKKQPVLKYQWRKTEQYLFQVLMPKL